MSAGAARVLPTLAVCLCCLWLAADDGGFYPRTSTAAAAALAALALALLFIAWRERSTLAPPAAVALVALASLTAWSFLTAVWAGAPGDAARGSLVTAIYLAAFAVPLLWPASDVAAERVMLALALAVAALGALGVARVVNGTTPLVYGRLAWPTGYPNTTAAFLALGAWLGLVVAARSTCSPLLRSLGFAAAVWIAGILVVVRSQGAVVTAVVAAAAFVALSRRRNEAILLLLLGGLIVAPAVPSLARIVNQYPEDQPAALRHAATLLAALTLASVPCFLLLRLVRRPLGALPVRGTVLGASAAVSLLLVLGIAVSSGRSAAAWHELTAGPAVTTAASPYYETGLAGNRADFWRVGLQAFVRRPVGGVGVDNFQASYLRERRSDEEPRSPHSLVVTAMSETGAIGTALLATVVGGIAFVLARKARGEGASGAAAQAAAVGLCGWLGHAQVDWLWEMPATGSLAFTLAGIGAGYRPAEPSEVAARPARARPLVRAAAVTGAAAVAFLAATLWLSSRYAERGVARWRVDPVAAAADLRHAARFDPLGGDALVLRGAVAARRGRWSEMRDAFAAASAREPSNWYAWFELGVARARLGDRTGASDALRHAASLNPREPQPRQLLRALESGTQATRVALDAALAFSAGER